MQKLLLSVTTGPALALAMRRCASTLPSSCRLRNTCDAANGTTSTGTPCFQVCPRTVERLRKSATTTNSFAASARTFSRRWHAPPPLIRFSAVSTLCELRYVLVRAVDRHVERREGVNVAELQAAVDDQVLGLESGRNKPAPFVHLGALGNNPLHDVGDGRACVSRSTYPNRYQSACALHEHARRPPRSPRRASPIQ